MHILKGYTKQEISWMMYDWANSAHSVIIVTLLPIFFDTVAGYTADSVSSMSTWGFATSLAMAIVALPGRVWRYPRYAQKAVQLFHAAGRCSLRGHGVYAWDGFYLWPGGSRQGGQSDPGFVHRQRHWF